MREITIRDDSGLIQYRMLYMFFFWYSYTFILLSFFFQQDDTIRMWFMHFCFSYNKHAVSTSMHFWVSTWYFNTHYILASKLRYLEYILTSGNTVKTKKHYETEARNDKHLQFQEHCLVAGNTWVSDKIIPSHSICQSRREEQLAL